MKGKIILVLALPVLLYVGAKVYLHLQVGRSVDAIAMQLAPFADVSYKSVTSSFDGRIGIAGMTIRPHEVADSISVREVSVKAPSLMYVLDLENRLNEGDFPTELSVSMLGVALSTRGPLLEKLEDTIYVDDPEGRLAAFDNCVTRTNSLPTQQYLLNYDNVSMDVEGGYYFDAASAQFVLHYRLAQEDAYDVSGEFAVPLDNFNMISLQAAMQEPELARAVLTISDEGYFERLYAYCDSEDRIGREQVVDLLTEKYLSMFDGLPVEPNEEMVSAYRQFVDSGSQIIVSVDPREPRRLSYLNLYAPEDVPALLNITTQVN